MAGHPYLLNAFLPYTASGTNLDPDWPVANLARYERQHESARSLTAQEMTVMLDLGDAVAIGGLALLNTNAQFIGVEDGDGVATWTDWPGSPFVMDVEIDANLRKRFILLDAPRTSQFIRLTLYAPTPDPGAIWFELGSAIVLPSPVVELPDPVYPFRVATRQARATIAMDSLGEDVALVGQPAPLAEIALPGPWLRVAAEATLRALVTQRLPVLLYEGAGDFSRVWIGWLSGASDLASSRRKTWIDMPLTFRESY